MNQGVPTTRVAVVGAGIVGLATARAIQQRTPSAEVVVVEKEADVAVHQSGRNSGVIHSGIYYSPGSRKASMVADGRTLLFEFCERHVIATELCGKVIVATSNDELPRLRALEDRAAQHGLRTTWLDPAGLRELEPHATGVAALLVPDAGITDYVGVCRALHDEIDAAGGTFEMTTSVTSIVESERGVRLETDRGSIDAEWLVNCAGLHSDRVAHSAALATDARIMPFRGEYYELTPAARSLVTALVYPVPDPRFPFLGVHFTRGVDGGVHAGPTAVLALAREGYSWRVANRTDVWEMFSDAGAWRLARRYWRTGAAEIHRALSKGAFVRALQRLIPEVGADDLIRSASGVRAQAMRSDGSLVDDFEFVDGRRSVHVVNAPSPAATASLAIGREIAERWARRSRE